MKEPLSIHVYERQQLVFAGTFDEVLELGRQCRGEDAPYCLTKKDIWRLVIARVEEDVISRQHLRIERLQEDQIRVQNLRRMPIHLPDGTVLAPQATQDLPLPVLLPFGKRAVRVSSDPEPAGSVSLLNLGEATRPPGRPAEASSWLRTLALPAGIDMEAVMRWLRVVMQVLHSASTSRDFLEQAAQGVVDLVGLDTCRVLMVESDGWKPETVKWAARVGHAPDWPPSRLVLDRVRQEKKTFWQVPNPTAATTPSLVGVKAVVAAPILNREGEVIGALYADRRNEGVPGGLPLISKVEAMLVELLACSAAAGLARVRQEIAALRARVQFEQFFTPELARLLASQPDLLEGRDEVVTVLFADICGFSRISERLGTARTVEWVGEVMGTLSDCVLAHGGVVVDYIGDELMAMWGAPERQADHARLACQAAQAMLECLPRLNAVWQPVIGEPFDLGIGVNTGPARVGNTGSRRKFKYGPLGNTVNLASRVQGVTRYLRTHLLITGCTHAQVGPDVPARRLGKVRVVNIDSPVELYEVARPGQTDWPVLKEGYEKALADFESKDLRSAARTLGTLILEYPDDGPALVLLSRVVLALVDEAKFNPILELSEK